MESTVKQCRLRDHSIMDCWQYQDGHSVPVWVAQKCHKLGGTSLLTVNGLFCISEAQFGDWIFRIESKDGEYLGVDHISAAEFSERYVLTDDDAARLADVRALLEREGPWPATLEENRAYVRFEDDSPTGRIAVQFTSDGDGWIEVFGVPDETYGTFSYRFRTAIGGGESPSVRAALMILAEAICMDNKENPQERSGQHG
jgi:hypothetical protein